MKISNKLIIFGLILFVSLTAVSAADIIDDDSSAVAVETPQVEPANTESIAPSVQETQQEDELENTDPGANPNTYSELTAGQTYNNAIITLGSDACFDDDFVTFEDNVTLTSANNKITINKLKINITGNNVTINNVAFNHSKEDTITTTIEENGENITNTENVIAGYNTNTKVIDIINASNVTINNTDIFLYKNTSYITMAISVTNLSDEIKINSTNIDVYSAAQGQTWVEDENHNWYSILSVSAVVFDNSTNIILENSSINIANTTTNFYYTTMPAITVRNASTNITIKNNTITSTGAKFVYGTMMTDNVYNVYVKNNTVDVSGLYYVAGIDISTSKDSVVCKNSITAISENATTFDPVTGEESLAYGIISDTYGANNENNKICLNNISVTANTIYGIEVYKGKNVTVCSNQITGNGNKSMGIALAHTNNSKIINNNITITGTTTPHHTFYEEVTPENTGIILTNQSNSNWIQGNYINVTAINDVSGLAINLTNDTSNTVTGNYVRVNYNEEGTYYSVDKSVIINADSGNNVTDDNTAVNLYPCDCCCECTPQNTVEPEEEEGDNFLP